MTIIHELNPKAITDIIASHENVLVDFWAEWCVPCCLLGENLEKLDEVLKDKITIVKINTEAILPDVEYDKVKSKKKVIKTSEMMEGLAFFKDVKSLEGIPVLVFFKNGKRVDKILDMTLEDGQKKYGKGLLFGCYEPDFIEDVMKKAAMI